MLSPTISHYEDADAHHHTAVALTQRFRLRLPPWSPVAMPPLPCALYSTSLVLCAFPATPAPLPTSFAALLLAKCSQKNGQQTGRGGAADGWDGGSVSRGGHRSQPRPCPWWPQTRRQSPWRHRR